MRPVSARLTRSLAVAVPSLLVPLLALLVACTPQVGNKCTLSTDCSQLGDRLCDTTQPGGYCTVFNCEPDQCPSSVCVAFGQVLDPACGATVGGRWPRFQRSFCLAACNGDGDCRDQYQCVDLSSPQNQIARSAEVVDEGAADGGLGYKVCMATTCGDGIQDGTETDVDCGGNACNPCINTKRCRGGGDCVSTICTNGICVGPECGDHVTDGTETDIDCGGIDCAACIAGQHCVLGSDCKSGLCNNSACLPGDCGDGVKDGVETDIDCGGGGCQACGLGQGCMVAYDCRTGYCSGQCSNGSNPCNTDADCTGGTCGGLRCVSGPIPAVCLPPINDAGPDAWEQYTPADASAD